MIFGRHIHKYYLRYWSMFLLGIIATVVVDIVQLEIPNNYGTLIDYLEKEQLTIPLLMAIITNISIIIIILFVGRFLWRICLLGASIKIERDLRKEMFLYTEKLAQTFFQTNKTGAQMALYTNDIMSVRECFSDGIIMFVDAIFLGTMAFIKMFKLNIALSLISAIPLLILALCGGIIGKQMDKKWDARQAAYDKMSDFTQENFSGILGLL